MQHVDEREDTEQTASSPGLEVVNRTLPDMEARSPTRADAYSR